VATILHIQSVGTADGQNLLCFAVGSSSST
jgi:hypothetical protein